MATIEGFCPKCGVIITAFVIDEDLRREGESGFAAWTSVEDVTCQCGGVLGEPSS